MDAKIARLSVLYEDLRIELRAISADNIPQLDILDSLEESQREVAQIGRYRKNYFLRRSIGTLYEFAENVRLMNQDPDFAPVRQGFDAELKAMWDSATRFFRQNEALIEDIRNDIGGHFGLEAARYAVANLELDAVGKIEVTFDDQKEPQDPRLHFAGEVAATAMCRHLSGKDFHEKLENLIVNLVTEAYGHATRCVQVIIVEYLWPRFGR